MFSRLLFFPALYFYYYHFFPSYFSFFQPFHFLHYHHFSLSRSATLLCILFAPLIFYTFASCSVTISGMTRSCVATNSIFTTSAIPSIQTAIFPKYYYYYSYYYSNYYSLLSCQLFSPLLFLLFLLLSAVILSIIIVILSLSFLVMQKTKTMPVLTPHVLLVSPLLWATVATASPLSGGAHAAIFEPLTASGPKGDPQNIPQDELCMGFCRLKCMQVSIT